MMKLFWKKKREAILKKLKPGDFEKKGHFEQTRSDFKKMWSDFEKKVKRFWKKCETILKKMYVNFEKQKIKRLWKHSE